MDLKKIITLAGLTALLSSCTSDSMVTPVSPRTGDWRDEALRLAYGDEIKSIRSWEITYNLGLRPREIQSELALPLHLNGGVYVEGYNSPSEILVLRIEGMYEQEKIKLPNEVPKCSKTDKFGLKLGERCYFSLGEGIVELHWDLVKQGVLLHMDAKRAYLLE